MQRPEDDIVSFANKLEEKLLVQIASETHDLPLRNALNRLHKELISERKDFSSNPDELSFLAFLNRICMRLFANNPQLWVEDDALAIKYKKLFFNRTAAELKEIGPLYPYPPPNQASAIVFNISKHGRIKIIRPYPTYTNVIYEGGGVKGIAYVGANRALSDAKVMQHVTRVAGSSAGAITAALIAIGYGDKQFSEETDKLDFKKLQDVTNPGGFLGSLFGVKVGIAKESFWGAAQSNQEVHNEAFINSGRALLIKLRELISQGVQRIINRATPQQLKLIEKFGILESVAKNRITFLDLENLSLICPEENIKTLIVTGSEKITDSRTRLILFSALHSPRTEIAQALRISASIPQFFRSVKYNNKYCIDGGVEENLPIRVFSRPEFQDDEVENSAIAQTIAFKFVSPGDEDKLHFTHRKSETKRGELLVLKEIAHTIAANRNRQGELIRGDLAPLIIPISNEGIDSTNFSLSPEEKARLETKGYTITKSMMETYNIENRGRLDEAVFDSFADAVKTLTLNEIEALLEKKANFIYVNGQIPDTPPISTDELKSMLEKQRATLLEKKKPKVTLSVEQTIQQRLDALEQRRKKLIDILDNNGSSEFFVKLKQDIVKTANVNPAIFNSLTSKRLDGQAVANYIMNAHTEVPLKDKNDFTVMSAINNMQDHMCSALAHELGYRDIQAVKNEIFSIKEQEVKELWPKIISQNNGFNLGILSHPAVVENIKSLSAYQELQSWAKRNPNHYLTERLNVLFELISQGDTEWLRSLIACNKKMIIPDGPKFTDPKQKTCVLMTRLYYNVKEGTGDVNLRPILDELVQDIMSFIKDNLLISRNDISNFTTMLANLPSNTTGTVQKPSP